jgi:anti-sigma B factor antagonist
MSDKTLQISERDVGEIKVIDMVGHLDTNTSAEAEQYLSKLIDDQDFNKILINFKDLNYISSAGLRILLVTTKKVKGKGGELKLSNMAPVVKEVFDISGFSMIISVHIDEEEALSKF